MRALGLDLDNTLADWSGAFRAAAAARGLTGALAENKAALRAALRARPNGELEWQALQAEVYAARADEAVPHAGARELVLAARRRGVRLCIVSHKTAVAAADSARRPLHELARRWLRTHGLVGDGAVDPAAVHFTETRAAKLERIAELALDTFVDDLPELLVDPAFPPGVRRFWFAPSDTAAPALETERVHSFFELGQRLFGADWASA